MIFGYEHLFSIASSLRRNPFIHKPTIGFSQLILETLRSFTWLYFNQQNQHYTIFLKRRFEFISALISFIKSINMFIPL
jgi:hypothetical protein